MDLLSKTVRKNANLVKAAARLHRAGEIPPDTYVVDLDTIRENASRIYNEAKKFGLESYICETVRKESSRNQSNNEFGNSRGNGYGHGRSNEST